jgi:hypothetical protein
MLAGTLYLLHLEMASPSEVYPDMVTLPCLPPGGHSGPLSPGAGTIHPYSAPRRGALGMPGGNSMGELDRPAGGQAEKDW